MTWKEMKNNPQLVKNFLEEKLKSRYGYKEENGRLVYNNPCGGSFSLILIDEKRIDYFFVIDYSNGEDGDSFYPKDYNDETIFVSDIFKEIDEE